MVFKGLLHIILKLIQFAKFFFKFAQYADLAIFGVNDG